MSKVELQTATDLLKAGNFRMGEEWENAHQLCQAHEGSPLFDWVHALVHRIEGDDRNAGYWYQRASKSPHTGSIEEEWQAIRAAVEKG